MSLRAWDEHVVPRLADASLRGRDIGERRDRVCEGLSGRILEIGFGTGLNVRSYPQDVTTVSAVEPCDVGWALSGKRRARRPEVDIRREGLDGQRLDLPTDSHDAALVTFSLCTIPDPLLALREVRRVVRPGGRLHFLEHGSSPDVRVARWQRALDPLERAVGAGCHLTRQAPVLVGSAGWSVLSLEERYLPGPAFMRPWTWLSMGVAQ